MSMVTSLRKQVNDGLAGRRVIQDQLSGLVAKKDSLARKFEVRSEAHSIVQQAAQMAQENVQKQIGTIVSTALAAVFPEPYEFVVEFPQKRGTVECEFFFQRNGERTPPLQDSGFGAADIASIALKISFREMGSTRPILVIDEPCKNLSRAYHEAAALIFKELCRQLGLQMIMVTHIEDFRQAADKLFMVEMDHNGVSTARSQEN